MSSWQALIGSLPFEWAQFAFMQNALLAVLIVAPLFALLGCMVINSQMAFFSDAMGHAALTGVAIGVLAGLADPLWAMICFALALTLLISWLRHHSAASIDTVIGLTMSLAVALGVVLLSRGGGFARYTSYLVGDILTISAVEIRRLLILLGGVLVLWVIFFNRMFFVSLNATLARSRAIRVGFMETLFAMIVALVVTVSIPWVGLLVINALLIVPAAAARNLARNMPQYIWGAVAISLASGMAGLVASFYWDTAAGATIVLFAMGCFVLSLCCRRR